MREAMNNKTTLQIVYSTIIITGSILSAQVCRANGSLLSEDSAAVRQPPRISLFLDFTFFYDHLQSAIIPNGGLSSRLDFFRARDTTTETERALALRLGFGGGYLTAETLFKFTYKSFYFTVGPSIQFIALDSVGGRISTTYPDRYDVAPVSISTKRFLQMLFVGVSMGFHTSESFLFEFFWKVSIGTPISWPHTKLASANVYDIQERRLIVFGVSLGPSFHL